MPPSSRSQSAAITALAGGTCELFRVKRIARNPTVVDFGALCTPYLRWQSGFCEEGRSSNASQFARDADADAAAGTTAAAGRAAAPASGRIEPARREGADLTRPTGRPRRRAHVALSKPSATPLRLPSRRLPCSLVAQAIDS